MTKNPYTLVVRLYQYMVHMSTTILQFYTNYNLPMISYEPLWETLKSKDISQYQLINLGIDRKTMDALRHNRNITAVTLEKLCKILECTPNDIIKFLE